MLELKVKENGKYEFVQHCTVVNGAGEYCIVVLGQHKDGRLVTWETMDGKDFHSGHYFAEGSFIEATRDMLRRASKWNYDVYQEPRKQLEEDGWFGIVMWSDDDLRNALEREEFPATKDNIDALACEANGVIEDDMIARGWDTLQTLVWNLDNNNELDRYDEDGNIVEATFED